MSKPTIRDSRDERLAALACVHVAQGWLEGAGKAAAEGESRGPADDREPGTSAFSEFLPVATRLCELESLAHRTAEVEAELASVLTAYEALAPRVLTLLPSGFPPRALRAFAGLAAAQRAWLEEVRWEEAHAKERSDWLPESPSRAWDALRPFPSGRDDETTNETTNDGKG